MDPYALDRRSGSVLEPRAEGLAMLTHPHAPTQVRPSNEDFERNVRDAMRDPANAISVAWLASEWRARFQESQLREEFEKVERGGR
jgi:hypothetical protein